MSRSSDQLMDSANKRNTNDDSDVLLTIAEKGEDDGQHNSVQEMMIGMQRRMDEMEKRVSHVNMLERECHDVKERCSSLEKECRDLKERCSSLGKLVSFHEVMINNLNWEYSASPPSDSFWTSHNIEGEDLSIFET